VFLNLIQWCTFSLLPVALRLFTVTSELRIFICIAAVLLPHTEPSLLPHTYLAVFRLSIHIPYVDKELLSMHSRHSLYFK